MVINIWKTIRLFCTSSISTEPKLFAIGPHFVSKLGDNPQLWEADAPLGNVSDAVTRFSGDLDLISGRRKNLSGHLLGFICPNNFICSLLKFLFAYHFPPRKPKPYLKSKAQKANQRAYHVSKAGFGFLRFSKTVDVDAFLASFQQKFLQV